MHQPTKLPFRQFGSLLALAGLLTAEPVLRAEDGAAKSNQAATGRAFYKLVLAHDRDAATKADPAASGDSAVQIIDLPLFNTPEFEKIVREFVGRPVDMALVHELGERMVAYAQAHDRLSLGLDIPPQDASSGVLRLCVRTGTYGQLTVRGNRWYSREQLLRTLGVREGDEVLLSRLNDTISRVNNSPFRRVQVDFNTDPADASRANATVNVADRIPIRTTLAYDNSGMPALGRDELEASVTHGNLWGLDHQATYDFRCTTDPKVLQSHSLLYKTPFASGDSLQFQAAYAAIDLLAYEGHLRQHGQNYIGRLSYAHPVKTAWGVIDLAGGIDYKQANTNLLFRTQLENSFSEADNRTYDVFQAFGSASSIIRDKHGAWLLGASLYASPGHLNHRNGSRIFNQLRTGADNTYVYGTVDLQRLLALPYGMEFLIQSHLQATSTNLQGSEQIVIGGSSTVRGYDERIVAGDEGATLSLELHSPIVRRIQPIWGKRAVIGTVQGVAFLDFAKVRYHEVVVTDGPLPSLASTGLGLRCAVTNLLSLNMDYGWILRGIHGKQTVKDTAADGTETYHTVTTSLPYGGRFTLRASLSY